MIWGLALTIGSLFFIILLFIVYFLKERFLSIRNKLYRYIDIFFISIDFFIKNCIINKLKLWFK